MQLVPGLRNENGNIVVSLLLVVLCFFVLVWAVRLPQHVASADVILNKSTAIAVKAAANQFDKKSSPKDKKKEKKTKRPNKYPRIKYNKAHMVFQEMLSKNLELTEDLEPKKYSAFSERPEYVLVIYNGDEGVKYEYADGNISQTTIPGKGFPKSFYVGEGIEVEFHSPGVLAVVEIKSKSIMGNEISYTRWAAAKITKIDGDYKSVLEKAV